MATKFSEDELKLLANTPHMIGTAMALAGGSGLIGTGKEMFASAQSILAGAKEHPGNALYERSLPILRVIARLQWTKPGSNVIGPWRG